MDERDIELLALLYEKYTWTCVRDSMHDIDMYFSWSLDVEDWFICINGGLTYGRRDWMYN